MILRKGVVSEEKEEFIGPLNGGRSNVRDFSDFALTF